MVGIPQLREAVRSLRRARPPQTLRRQGGTYLGFDERDIRGIDRAIHIYVFAEIRAANYLPNLRLGYDHIGGVDSSIAIYITD